MEEFVPNKNQSSFICRNILIFIFIIIITFNSFSAIVQDNDGSAFITKFEFETLKKDFSQQISKYNASIDSKIDGHIASYLDGIKLHTKIELPNLYKMITDKKKVYWVSGQYQRTANKPVPKLSFFFWQAFNTTAYQIVANWPGANLYLYEGKEKEGKYYVDYLMDLDATFVEYETYLLGDQGFSGVPNADYDPYDSSMPAVISLVNPGIYASHHYSPNGNMTDRGNFRGIFSAYFYEEDQTESTNLMFTPWSTKTTYAHISNNKDAISNTAGAKFPYYPYVTTSDRYVTPTLTDVRTNTTKQTVNPLTATKKSYRINIAKLDAMYFPWLQKQWVMNEIYYSIVNDVTGEELPIKYGIKICETTGEGTLKIKMKADNAGVGVFHVGNPISSWPKTANLNNDETRIYSTKNLAANEEGVVEFDCMKDEKVWFVYCGANETAGCQVEFTSMMQTAYIKE